MPQETVDNSFISEKNVYNLLIRGNIAYFSKSLAASCLIHRDRLTQNSPFTTTRGLKYNYKGSPPTITKHIKHINIPWITADPSNDKGKDTANVPHKALHDIILRFCAAVLGVTPATCTDFV